MRADPLGQVIHEGEVVLIVHRRLFTDDQPRFFVGVVDAYDGGVARITGYTWRRDPHVNGAWRRKPDLRTKIASLTSGTLMVYSLPLGPERIGEVELFSSGDGSLLLRDGQGFQMDLSERMAS